MVKKSINVVKSSIPTIRPFVRMTATNFNPPLRRSAKFGPQLIAEGLLNGVTNEQGNLVKGFFDDPNSNIVEPSCNIDSDKFSMMIHSMVDASVDPASSDEN